MQTYFKYGLFRYDAIELCNYYECDNFVVWFYTLLISKKTRTFVSDPFNV